MSRFPKQWLPPYTDPAVADDYQHTLRLAERHLYDPDSLTVVGRLPTSSDNPIQTDEAVDEAVRELSSRFGAVERKSVCSNDTLNYGRFQGKALLMADITVRAVVALQPVQPGWGWWRRDEEFWKLQHDSRVSFITAFYIPLSHADLIFARLWLYNMTSPTTRYEEDRATLEEVLAESQVFWFHARESERRQLCLDQSTAVVSPSLLFERQNDFWIGEEEYVRWVPMHPFIPLGGNVGLLELVVGDRRECFAKTEHEYPEQYRPPLAFAETVTLLEDDRLAILKDPKACFFLDGQWDRPFYVF